MANPSPIRVAVHGAAGNDGDAKALHRQQAGGAPDDDAPHGGRAGSAVDAQKTHVAHALLGGVAGGHVGLEGAAVGAKDLETAAAVMLALREEGKVRSGRLFPFSFLPTLIRVNLAWHARQLDTSSSFSQPGGWFDMCKRSFERSRKIIGFCAKIPERI